MPDWKHIAKKAGRLVQNMRGLSTDFTWDGCVYGGVRTVLRREDVANDAGLIGEYSFSLMCFEEQFAGRYPESRQTITIDGKDFRILSVEHDAIDAFIRINLGGIWS